MIEWPIHQQRDRLSPQRVTIIAQVKKPFNVCIRSSNFIGVILNIRPYHNVIVHEPCLASEEETMPKIPVAVIF